MPTLSHLRYLPHVIEDARTGLAAAAFALRERGDTESALRYISEVRDRVERPDEGPPDDGAWDELASVEAWLFLRLGRIAEAWDGAEEQGRAWEDGVVGEDGDDPIFAAAEIVEQAMRLCV